MPNWYSKLVTLAAASPAKLNFLARKYQINSNDLDRITHIDPSPKGEFTEWLAKGFANEEFSFSAGVVYRDILDKFMELKNSPYFKGSKDINDYTSMVTLEKTVLTADQLSKQETQKQNAQKGQTPIYQDSQYKVLAITNAEAATQYCKGSDICIKDPKFFNQYPINSQQPAYIILKHRQTETNFYQNSLSNPNFQPYAVFFPQTGEFNDMANESIFTYSVMGKEMQRLFQNVPNGQNLLHTFINTLIQKCENPTKYKQLHTTLENAMKTLGYTEEQWKAFDNIQQAYPLESRKDKNFRTMDHPDYDGAYFTPQPTPTPEQTFQQELDRDIRNERRRDY